MDLEWYYYPLILIAGFFAGVINMYAGGGSLIALSAMIFAGLPAGLANGTNRVAIFLQNIIGVRGYHEKELLDFNYAWKVAIPGMIGSAIGASISVSMNEEVLRRVIGGIMLGMLVVLFINPKRLIEGKEDSNDGVKVTTRDIILFFFIGLYGGFLQAGIGIFLLLSLVLSTGYNLIRANAVKVFMILCQSAVALAIFAYNGQVNWVIGLVLAAGNMSGAWVATRFADHPSMAQWAYYLLVGVIIFSGVRLVLFP